MLEPLVPPDCDCRGLPYMPLEVGRLVDSDLFALSSGEAFKAAVALWCRSWSQVPAASLPDDERILAKLSGLHLSQFRKVKDMALRGWVKCSDGRLYHPLIADLAAAAFKKRRNQAERANSRWAAVRQSHGNAAAMPRQSHGNASIREREEEQEKEERPSQESTDDSEGTTAAARPSLAVVK